MAYKCYNCDGGFYDGCDCPQPERGFKWIVMCERIGCDNPSCGKPIYGMGYLASVCEEHYQQASIQDKQDAIRFRHVE